MEKESKKNNLFTYATSELSQDAFICWLINWINFESENEYLYLKSKKLLDKFFDLFNDYKNPDEYFEVIIKKQFENIDVLLVVNDEYVIIIEDKTDTENHSDQLNRYVEVVEKNKGISIIPKDYKLLKIYFKTGNQSNLNDVISKDYKPFMRRDFLEILDVNSEKINNAIFNDYHEYLQNIEKDTKSYLTEKVNNWNRLAWQGFYIELQGKLNLPIGKEKGKFESEWDYVANSSGGFQGFWWYWNNINDGEIYLQLEQDTFCFKIMVENKLKRSELRNSWHEKIMKTCEGKNENVCKPDRFGYGKFMTVAVLKDYRCTIDEKIDMGETIKQLIEMENILKETHNKSC